MNEGCYSFVESVWDHEALPAQRPRPEPHKARLNRPHGWGGCEGVEGEGVWVLDAAREKEPAVHSESVWRIPTQTLYHNV